MPNVETLDHLPPGWHALTVMRKEARKWDWLALATDVPPDELKHCRCGVAMLFVHPDEYRPVEGRVAKEAWVRVPGKHRNQEAAWDALQEMLATRH